MKAEWKKFAPIGLYVALAAALASAGIGIVYKEFNLALQISIGVLVLGLAAFVILDPEKVRLLLTGRQAKYGSNALLLTIAALGIVIAVNFIVFNNSYRWDLTEDKTNTLTDQTLDTLSSLPEPVTAQAFYSTRYPTTTAAKLLDSYKFYSKGKFTYEFIDPEANPLAAQTANVTRDGTIVLTMGSQSEQITYADEQSLTGALVRLINPGKRSVYFLTGHGEYDPAGTDEFSYSQAVTTLTAKNYVINTINLLSTPSIPEDAKVIVIAGPRKPISQSEMDLIKVFMENGGSLIVLYEPSPLTDFGNSIDPLASYLTTDWGIEFDNDVIIDPNVNPPLIAVANAYDEHPITNKMMQMASIFPTARSLHQASLPENITQTNLVWVASSAWGETDFNSIEQNRVTADSDTDLMGPVSLAIAANNQLSNARLLALGDADFATNQFFTQYGNSDFFINAIDWAAEQESIINLTPKQPVSRYMAPPSLIVQGVILLLTVFIIPGLVLVGGIVAFILRKRRG